MTFTTKRKKHGHPVTDTEWTM